MTSRRYNRLLKVDFTRIHKWHRDFARVPCNLVIVVKDSESSCECLSSPCTLYFPLESHHTGWEVNVWWTTCFPGYFQVLILQSSQSVGASGYGRDGMDILINCTQLIRTTDCFGSSVLKRSTNLAKKTARGRTPWELKFRRSIEVAGCEVGVCLNALVRTLA